MEWIAESIAVNERNKILALVLAGNGPCLAG